MWHHWYGDEYRGVVSTDEMNRLCEAGEGGRFYPCEGYGP